MPPFSMLPYVANASAVAGVNTGMETSVESAAVSPNPLTRTRAVPAARTFIGKRTSMRSSAGTVTLRLTGPVASRFAVWITTSTLIGVFPRFCNTTGNSN